MIQYFLCYILTLCFSVLHGRGYRNNYYSALFNKFIFLGMALPITLLGGFRATSVGTDTLNYSYLFQYIPINISDFVEKIKLSVFDEPGFKVFQFVFRFFELDFNYFLLAISFFIVFVYLNEIIKLSKYKFFSVFVFLMFGYYTFHFNGARQAIAMAIFFSSLKYAIDKNYLKFYLFLFIGFLFHKSIIICIPVVFLIKTDINFKKIIFLVILTALVASFIDLIVNFASQNIDSRYSGFGSQRSEAMGVVYNLTNLMIFIFIYFVKLFCNVKGKFFNACLNLSLIGVLLGVVSIILKLDPNGIARGSYYFTQLFVYLIPIAIYSIPNVIFRSYSFVLVIIVGVAYFYLTTTSLANLYPYSFFF